MSDYWLLEATCTLECSEFFADLWMQKTKGEYDIAVTGSGVRVKS